MTQPAPHPVAHVLSLCIGRLSDVTWLEADDLLAAGEAETALTLLCAELLDADVSITQEIYDAIRAASIALDLGPSPSPGLERLIRD